MNKKKTNTKYIIVGIIIAVALLYFGLNQQTIIGTPCTTHSDCTAVEHEICGCIDEESCRCIDSMVLSTNRECQFNERTTFDCITLEKKSEGEICKSQGKLTGYCEEREGLVCRNNYPGDTTFTCQKDTKTTTQLTEGSTPVTNNYEHGIPEPEPTDYVMPLLMIAGILGVLLAIGYALGKRA